MRKIKARKGVYSMQGCSHWQETVIINHKIYFKQRSSTNQKPDEKYKKDLYRGDSVAPLT